MMKGTAANSQNNTVENKPICAELNQALKRITANNIFNTHILGAVDPQLSEHKIHGTL